MKNVLKYIAIYIVTITCFVGLLVLTALIPREKLKDNVKQSSKLLLQEGNKKNVYIPYRGYEIQFDNYSDSLMINTAYSINPSTPLYSVFVARKNYIPNVTTEVYEDYVGELKSSSKYEYHDEVGELNDLVNNEKAESFEYARYWHGYLVILRPLLVLFNLLQIRLILKIILILVVALLTFLVYKKINIFTAFIYIIALIGVEYFYMYYSIHGIFTFLVAMISSIIILVRYNKTKNVGIIFFVTGMITNFNDLLSCPFISLCMPLLIYFMLEYKNKYYNIRVALKKIFKLIFLWLLGYILTWLTKWILIDLIYNKGLIVTSIKQVLYRSVGSEKNYTALSTILSNLEYEKMIINVTILINMILQHISIAVSKKRLNFNVKISQILKIAFEDFIIAIIPIIIYALLQNHSFNHSFFTYRNLLITNLAINTLIIKIYDILFRVS